MHPSALLGLGTELLGAVLRFDTPADAAVSAFFRTHRALGQRERQALAETIYAVLRKRLLFQHLARSGPGPLERRLLLLGWQGEPRVLAALEDGERRWLERARAFDAAALPEALRHNLPEWIAGPLRAALGDAGFWALVASLDGPAPLDLRVNALRAKRDDLRAELAAAGIEAAPTPFSPWGLRVQGKPALAQLDAYARGDIEVQDEGSQLLALLTGARRGEIVVDFCAGAGGKTLALGAMMRGTGRLYAFDVSAHRLDALEPRLARSGLANVHRVAIAHERDERVKRLAGKADRVLVDAPCSGLGTLRRKPDLKWRQSPQVVEALQARQTAILASAARLVKPGGRLVYATCSLLEAENEAVAAVFSAAHPEFEPKPAGELLAGQGVTNADSLTSSCHLRSWPHLHSTDGFFAAVWLKN